MGTIVCYNKNLFFHWKNKCLLPFLVLAFYFNTAAQDSISLATQADVFYNNADYYAQSIDSNIYFIQQAIPLYKEAKNWEQYINCYNYFSLLYHLKEDFSMYHLYALKALEESAKYLKKTDAAFISALNNMGVYYMHIGDYRRAVQIFEESINDIEEADRNFNSCGRTYINIGICYKSIADYEEAIQQLENALFFINKIDEKYKYLESASIYALLGECYQLKGNIENAKKYFNLAIQSLNQWGEKNKYSEQIRFDALLSLASIYSEENNFKKANNYLDLAAVIQNKYSLFQDFKTYELRGKIKEKQGDKTAALALYYKAQEAAQKESDNSFDLNMVANSLSNIACLYAELNQPEKALEYFQRSLFSISVQPFEMDYNKNPSNESFAYAFEAVQILGKKATCIKKQYDHTQNEDYLLSAYNSYDQAIDLIQNIRHSFHEKGSKEFLSEIFNPIYEGGISSAFQLYKINKDKTYLEKAFSFAENIKAINLLESINETTAKGVAGIPDSLLLKERELNVLIAYTNKRITEGKQSEKMAPAETDELKETLRNTKKEFKDLIAFFEKQYPKYHKLKFDTRLASVQQIQQDLPGKESCFIEYFFGADKIYAFSIIKTDIKLYELEQEENLIDNIEELYNQINNEPSSRNASVNFSKFAESAYSIYASLIEPLVEEGTTELIIVPDDVLGYIPLEVLIKTKPEAANKIQNYKKLDYLFNDFAISYNYSGTLMLYNSNQKNKRKSTSNFIAFAPSFEEGYLSERMCNEEVLYNLECADTEAAAINDLFDGNLFKGLQANKDNFESNVSNFKIIHLATHACVDMTLANNNKIYFTDDYLSNSDLYNLQMNADLAVLSACNTGYGKLVKGEGLMSLSRGFVHAGCPSLLMSLWSVDDCSTSSLMIDFYKNLKEGNAKNYSLQEAKIAFMQNADKLHSHPYYWAPFVQFGRTDSISFGNSIFGFWLIGGLGLCAILAMFFFKLQGKQG